MDFTLTFKLQMSPYNRYSLKSLPYLITTQLDNYFKYLLIRALSLYNTFSYNNVFL